MRLDLWTLIVVTIFVTTLLGGLLLFSWRQSRRIGALAWWGSGFLLAAFASCLFALRGRAPDLLTVVIANAAIFCSYGLLWTGCRSFAGRKPNWWGLGAGACLWIALCAVPAFYNNFGARVLAASLLTAGYSLACAIEMRRTCPERLASRAPICIVLVLHAVAMACRPGALMAFGASHDATIFSIPWITAHAFEALLATVLLAFLFLAISKERVEQEQRTMASRDPLTGALNRRAFVERGERELAAAQPGEEAVLCLLDIDHFKGINDAHGHAAGDTVLENFARLAADALPPGSLFARLGGEEFGCLLPRTSQIDGYYAAEYLRNALALSHLDGPGGRGLSVTVSIGVATTRDFGRDLQALLSAADAALYRAKRAGRNRVVCGTLSVTRVA
jgi:diguanylate cyclase (GGDEF)-like protein